MDLHATEWNEVLIATCEKWLEKQCAEAVRRFPLYGGAVELTVGQATPETYEAFCAALQGECLYESHMAGNFYRLLTVDLPPIQRCAAGGCFTLEVSVHIWPPSAAGSAGVHRREQKGDKTPNGFLSPS